MCVIIYCKTKKIETIELKKAWDANPDGAGVAWVDNGNSKFIKGIMSYKQLQKIVDKLPLPCVIHCRITSAGATNKELTHPTIIDNNASLSLQGNGQDLLFYNGHQYNWEMELKQLLINNCLAIPDGQLNDTRYFALLAYYIGQNILSLYSHKFLIMTATGDITTYGAWKQKDDIYYSNLNHATIYKPVVAQSLLYDKKYIGGYYGY